MEACYEKSQLILRKSLCSLAAIISLVALLSSPVTFKMYEVKDYASSLIDTFANQSDGSAMSIAVKAAVESGLKQDLVDQLPDKVEISESHLSLYRLVSRYRQNKRLQSSNLKLPAKNKVQLFMDDLILYLVNSELNVHEGELQQITQIYQLSLCGSSASFTCWAWPCSSSTVTGPGCPLCWERPVPLASRSLLPIP